MELYELEQRNPIYLYEILFSDINYKLTPIQALLKQIPSGWLAPFIFFLENQPSKLLEMISRNDLTVSDFALCIEQVELSTKGFFSLAEMSSSTEVMEYIQQKGFVVDIISARLNLIKINKKLYLQCKQSMAFCLDKLLRKYSIDLLNYFDSSSGETVFNIEQLKTDIQNKITELKPGESASFLLKEFMDCVRIFSKDDWLDYCASAVNQYYSVKGIAKELDDVGRTIGCRRLNYFAQGLDIASIILGGFCWADAHQWVKVKQSDDGYTTYTDNFQHYEQLHQMPNSNERIKFQYQYEKNIYEGKLSPLFVQSKVYKISTIQPEVDKEDLGKISSSPEILKIKKEAIKLAKRALIYVLKGRNHGVNYLFLSFIQSGIGASHVCSLKLIKKNGKIYLQFRDANSGCFEFDTHSQFYKWFSEYYVISNSHFFSSSYNFNYSAPLSYARAYEWLLSQNESPKLKLAAFSHLTQNAFNENTSDNTLQLYKYIKDPNVFDTQQLLFSILGSAMDCISENADKAKILLRVAEKIIVQLPSPKNVIESLLYLNIYQLLSLASLKENNVSESAYYYQILDDFLTKTPEFFTSQFIIIVRDITKAFQANQSLEYLKESLETLNYHMTILNIKLQIYFEGKLYKLIKPVIEFAEFKLQRVYEHSFNIHKKEFTIFNSLQRQKYMELYSAQQFISSTCESIKYNSAYSKKCFKLHGFSRSFRRNN